MVVVDFRRLVFSLILIIAVTAGLITAAISIEGGTEWFARIDIQNFLFWGFTALAAQLWIGFSLIVRHKRVIRTLNRISTYADITHPQAEKSFREIGSLGTEIRKMLLRENELAVMRAGRIVSLNNLVRMLCEGYSGPVAVTDVNGAVLGISGKLTEKLTKDKQDTIIANIAEIRPDIKITEVLGYIEKQRMPWNDPEDSGLVCTPVFDNKNLIHFCIWEFEASRLTGHIKEIAARSGGGNSARNRVKGFVNSLPGRKRHKQS